MNPETIFAALASVLFIAGLAYAFMRARQEHQLAVLRLEAAMRAESAKPAPASEVAPTKRVGLTVLRGGKTDTCATCAHFDYELGQKEMASHPPFGAAMQHVPPWRMGHTMKVDAEGKHLPIEQQGISKEMLQLRWDEMGACVEHQELRAPFDTCPKYEPATRTGTA